MIFVFLFTIFVVFAGLAGSILRRKLYKKLLSLSLSFNALIVFAGLIACANDHNALRIYCLCAIFTVSLSIIGAFYICYEGRS